MMPTGETDGVLGLDETRHRRPMVKHTRSLYRMHPRKR